MLTRSRRVSVDRTDVYQLGYSTPNEYRVMSNGIVPLRRRGEDQSALARVDDAALKMLVGGQATSLMAARAEVILAELRDQRRRMATLVTDLLGQDLTDKPPIDEADAHLIMAINQGIVQIDLFIAQAQVCAAEVT